MLYNICLYLSYEIRQKPWLMSDDDAESGASGVNAGNGAAEESGVADGVAEEKSKCEEILLIQ